MERGRGRGRGRGYNRRGTRTGHTGRHRRKPNRYIPPLGTNQVYYNCHWEEDNEYLNDSNIEIVIRGPSYYSNYTRGRPSRRTGVRTDRQFISSSEHWPELGAKPGTEGPQAEELLDTVVESLDWGDSDLIKFGPIEEVQEEKTPPGENSDNTTSQNKVEQKHIPLVPVFLDFNTHLPEMEHFVKEAVEELHKKGVLTDEDRDALTYRPREDPDKKSSGKGGGRSHLSFPYPDIPLVRFLANLIEDWMWNGTCTTRELKVYEHLDERDADSRRKMVMDTVSCHMMGLRSSWDGLEDDMKKYKIVQLLTDLGKRGMMDLVGVRDTVGTQLVFPPTRDILEESFREQNKSGSALTVGARALAKHCHRDESSNWWGNLSGSETAKNESAEKVLRKILNDVGWLNIHQLPHALPIMEVRNIEGYGARWSPDGREFRGFLEPPMVAGWETGYRH